MLSQLRYEVTRLSRLVRLISSRCDRVLYREFKSNNVKFLGKNTNICWDEPWAGIKIAAKTRKTNLDGCRQKSGTRRETMAAHAALVRHQVADDAREALVHQTPQQVAAVVAIGRFVVGAAQKDVALDAKQLRLTGSSATRRTARRAAA